MIYFCMIIALLLLPYCVIRISEGYKHNFIACLIYCFISVSIFYLQVLFDNGFDASDSMKNTRLLVPYFIFSIPLSILSIGIIGWVRHLRYSKL